MNRHILDVKFHTLIKSIKRRKQISRINRLNVIIIRKKSFEYGRYYQICIRNSRRNKINQTSLEKE